MRSSSHLLGLALWKDIFAHHSLAFPIISPSSLPLHPSYGVDLFEDDYLFLLPVADLRMDPALRLRPVSSVALVTLYNSTARLNDGIFTVHRFSVATSTRLRKSECVFRFYVYGGIFDNPPGYLLSARGTVFGALCADGFFWVCWGYWCAFCLFRTLWFGMEDCRLVVYREADSMPEELLLGQGRVFSI
jgi:hypothetical protein